MQSRDEHGLGGPRAARPEHGLGGPRAARPGLTRPEVRAVVWRPHFWPIKV